MIVWAVVLAAVQSYMRCFGDVNEAKWNVCGFGRFESDRSSIRYLHYTTAFAAVKDLILLKKWLARCMTSENCPRPILTRCKHVTPFRCSPAPHPCYLSVSTSPQSTLTTQPVSLNLHPNNILWLGWWLGRLSTGRRFASRPPHCWQRPCAGCSHTCPSAPLNLRTYGAMENSLL